jgi:hypothetical protein
MSKSIAIRDPAVKRTFLSKTGAGFKIPDLKTYITPGRSMLSGFDCFRILCVLPLEDLVSGSMAAHNRLRRDKAMLQMPEGP